MEGIHGIGLVFLFGRALGEEARPFEHQAFVGRKTALGAALKDFDLCSHCADSIAHDGIRPLVPDGVMLQLEIDEHQ